MPYQDLNIKQKVKVGEKIGQIVECGDKYKVKFDDGSFAFHDSTEITPIVLDTEYKSKRRFNRMKEESKMQDGEIFMQPTATGSDPLSQPTNNTNEGIGEPQNVLGKSASNDVFMISKGDKEDKNMKKKKEIDEEIESPDNLEKEEDKEEEKKEVDMEDNDSEDEEEKKKKKKKSKKESDDDEDDVEKQEGSGESPEESASSGADSNSTITPNMSTLSQSQDVFVPPSDVDGKREQETPIGKSVNPDLMKSPLFVSLSSQIDGIREAVGKKVDALEKSVNDRLNNVLKDMAKIEKFYKQSFYKAINENVAPESTQALSIQKQIELGKVRFRN